MRDRGVSTITLEVMTGGGNLRDFLALPHRLYASDPAWIAPLNFMQRERFSPKNHFFEQAASLPRSTNCTWLNTTIAPVISACSRRSRIPRW
jgi:hypothetical protein